MPERLNLVKAIVRYTSFNTSRVFVRGKQSLIGSARYLLLQIAKDEFPENIGKWEFVGSVIKNGENSKEAVMKAIKEKTGLEYIIVKQLPTQTKMDKGNTIKCDVYVINTPKMDIPQSNDYSDYMWFRKEDVSKQDLALHSEMLLEFFKNPEKYLD